MKRLNIILLSFLLVISSCSNNNNSKPYKIDILNSDNEVINEISLGIGESIKLNYLVLDKEGNSLNKEYTYSYSFTDSSICSISEDNLIGLTSGYTTLTVSITEFNITSNLFIFVKEDKYQTGIGTGFSEKDSIYLGNEGKDEPLEIYFIEMRQMYGDSIYIKKGNVDILIDSGEAYDGKLVNSILKEKMDDDRLDLLIATHGDSDHIAGMKNALTDISYVSTIIDYGGISSSEYVNLRNSYISKGSIYHSAYDCVNYTNGITSRYYLTSEFYFDVIDTGEYLKNNENKSASNPESVTLIFTYKDFKFFTGGDITSSTESSILKRNKLPEVTLYKASHHGSSGSNSQDFMNTLNPKGVAISAARYSTSYGVAPSDTPNKNESSNLGATKGHPHSEALERIYKIPRIMSTLDVYWNAVNGTMRFLTYGTDSFEFSGSGPLKGYYDISKDTSWNEKIQDFNNKVTGENNLRFSETIAFKNRELDYILPKSN